MAEILRSPDADQEGGEPATPEQEKEKRVKDTAFGPAECRAQIKDIFLAEEIWEEVEKLYEVKNGKPYEERLGKKSMPKEYLLVFEARYKFISKLVKEYESKQIIEIASGYSPRGIEMARDPSVNYVELDLPDITEEKRVIINNLVSRQKIPKESNLHIVEGDARRSQDLEAAAKTAQFLDGKPLTIINEGLFKYLDMEDPEMKEKAALGRNIHQLLSRFGGVWITPDFRLDIPSIKESDRVIEEHTGLDFQKGTLKTPEQFIAFFEKLGFTVEQRNFEEITDKLLSPEKICFDEQQTRDIMKKATAFVMRVAE